jgi:hypothetical protein
MGKETVCLSYDSHCEKAAVPWSPEEINTIFEKILACVPKCGERHSRECHESRHRNAGNQNGRSGKISRVILRSWIIQQMSLRV